MNQKMMQAAAVLAATGGFLAAGAAAAHADASAAGSATGSPGVGSGNVAQVPIDVPVNVCGNTVNVIGALNPTFGNHCTNGSMAAATANGSATDSPGVVSGNLLQAPVNVPVNVTGNTANVIGVLNGTFGNSSSNGGGCGGPQECPPLDNPSNT